MYESSVKAENSENEEDCIVYVVRIGLVSEAIKAITIPQINTHNFRNSLALILPEMSSITMCEFTR